MLLIFKERVCALGTDFTDIAFLGKNKQAVVYCKLGYIAIRARTSRTLTFEAKQNLATSLSSRISRSLFLLPNISEGVCPFRHGLHGHCLLTKKKKMAYIALVEDFTEFGLASKTFRRGVSVSARTSRTLAFEGQKKTGVYRSRRGYHGVWSCFQKFQKGCFRFGTDFTDIGF